MAELEDLTQDEWLDTLLAELLPLATRHWDDDEDTEPMRHVLTTAGTVPPPETTAPRSVFELSQGVDGAALGQVRVHRHNFPGSPSGFATSASAPPRRAVNTVARAGDRVRVSGLAYPDGRWTAERAEKERARRARQRLPRPSAAARQFRIGKGAAPAAGAAALA